MGETKVNRKWLWFGLIWCQFAAWLDLPTRFGWKLTPLSAANVVASGVFVLLLLAFPKYVATITEDSK